MTPGTEDPAGDHRIRAITDADLDEVVAMVHELAAYERAEAECHLTRAQLAAALGGPAPALFGHVAVDRGAADEEGTPGRPVGFALWFLNFSTWEGVHGVYLEDLYVRPSARGTGLGRALLATLARACVTRGYARLEWSVLDWNTPARDVYHALGAAPAPDWVPYRLDGPGLAALAGVPTGGPRP